MALDRDPQMLWRNIRAGEERRDETLQSLERQIESYTGPWYSGDLNEHGQFDPENTLFNYMAHLVPTLVPGAPKVRSKSRRRSQPQRMASRMARLGLNRLCAGSNLEEELTLGATDYGFRWAVFLTTAGYQPESYNAEAERTWPQATRLSPRQFGWDGEATSYSRARLAWYTWTIDKDQLVAMAQKDRSLPQEEREGWDYEAIVGLATGSRPAWGHGHHMDSRFHVEREQVTVYSVWISRASLGEEAEDLLEPDEEGVWETLATCGDADSPVRIKDTEPYYGHRRGPFVVIGSYIVPDRAEPLSGLVATQGQHEQLNRAVRAADRASEHYKKFVAVAGNDPSLQEAVSGASDNFVVPLRNLANLQGKLANVEVGGITSQLLALIELYQDRVNRNLGFDDVQRGAVSGDGTATEIQQAVSASGRRMGHIKGQWDRGVAKVLENLLFYLASEGGVEVDVTEDAIGEFGLNLPDGARVILEGGDMEPGSGHTLDDLELELDPWVDPAQEALEAQFLTEFLLQVGPALPQLAQFTDMDTVLEEIGRRRGMPWLPDAFDVEMAARLGQGQPAFGPTPQALFRTHAGNRPTRSLPAPIPGRVAPMEARGAQGAAQALGGAQDGSGAQLSLVS